ncbi:hypothetical protein BU15DRAFT_73160 [Melanogaster broomeanus]|nr:hypothetical protein BU15DRAFT_73160 [Melanogaster broomeanus]
MEQVPAKTAKENLTGLLRELIQANGGSRLRKALLNGYNLFYSAICRKKNQEGEMEDWWAANEAEFAALKMHFDGHACVTTLVPEEGDSLILKQRCLASRETVLAMIANTCSRDDRGTGQESWLAPAMADPPTSSYTTYPNTRSRRSDLRRISPRSPGRLMRIEDSPFNVYRVRDRQLLAGGQFKKKVTSRGADLLIFCASIGADLQESRRKLVSFYESYDGETRPLLVVVRGAETDEEAHGWWNRCNNGPKTGCWPSSVPSPRRPVPKQEVAL